jgi:hypothetical protein
MPPKINKVLSTNKNMNLLDENNWTNLNNIDNFDLIELDWLNSIKKEIKTKETIINKHNNIFHSIILTGIVIFSSILQQ